MRFRHLGPLVAALLSARCAPRPESWPVVRDLAGDLPVCEARREAEHPGPPRPPQPPLEALATRVAEGIAISGGTRVDGYLAIEGHAALGIDGTVLRGSPISVEIELATEGEGEDEEGAWLNPGPRAETWEIPGEGTRLVRWTLRAEGSPDHWAIVRRPVLRALPASHPVSAGGRRPAESNSAAARPNVLLYLIDTLRADRLGAYGSRRALTPRIDALAAQGFVFERTTAASSWTKPSTATILSGLPPQAHGATRLERRLPGKVRTLAEELRDAGYRTGGFSANAHVTAATGFDQGFDRFEFLPELAGADRLADRAKEWLEGADSPGVAAGAARPFFLYLHTIEPHAPYEPAEDLRRRFAAEVPPGTGSLAQVEETYRALGRRRPDAQERVARLARLYDAEVAEADRGLGLLLDELDRRGRLDETLVVVISDHGEELGEHGGIGHGKTLYREVLDVPWIVRLPGQKSPRKIATPAAHVDVFPTILAAIGRPASAELRGVDLLAPSTKARPLFAHLEYEGRLGARVELDGWSLIDPWSRKFSRRPKLFFRADRDETRDLAAEHPVRAGYLRSLLRAQELAQRHPVAASAPLGEQERKALEALGYL